MPTNTQQQPSTNQRQEQQRKLMERLSPQSRRRVASLMSQLQRLEGPDRTYAIVSTMSSVLNDLGKLEGAITRDQFNDVIGTFDLAMSWDNLSDVNKFIRGGQKIINAANKYAGADIPFAGDALSIAGLGFSQYQLINNWDRLDTPQKIVGIANTISNSTQAYNLLNNFAGSATSTGAAAASGVGATTGSTAAATGNAVSQGTASLGSAATVETGAAAAGGSSAASTVANGAAVVGGIYGAYQLVENFGEGGADGRASGAMSGAAVGAGVAGGMALAGAQMMAWAGPIGMALGAVVGLAIGSVKTGKSKEQGARDSYRDYMSEMGIFTQSKDVDKTQGFNLTNAGAGELFDEMHLLELADGSFYQVGVDGSNSRATFQGENKVTSDSSRILERDAENFAEGNELRPYEVDYTNDLDFFASHSLTGLGYILGGGAEQGEKSGEFQQMLGYMTNGAVSNAGSREFSQENFDVTMANIRNIYKKAGITNSDQAYNLLNQLKAEGKISEDQFNIAAQGIRTAFNNDFEYAQELNSTRFEGLQTQGETEDFVSQGEGPLEGGQPSVNLETGEPSVEPIARPQGGTLATDPVQLDTSVAPVPKPTTEQDLELVPEQVQNNPLLDGSGNQSEFGSGQVFDQKGKPIDAISLTEGN